MHEYKNANVAQYNYINHVIVAHSNLAIMIKASLQT